MLQIIMAGFVGLKTPSCSFDYMLREELMRSGQWATNVAILVHSMNDFRVAVQRDVEQVQKDLHRTWSPGTLSAHLPCEDTLGRVLLAYAQHNPDIGYCQGTPLLLHMPKFSPETCR
jgi:hypothetical protein